MKTNLDQVQKAVDIADNVNFARGEKSDVRKMNILTESLTSRQLRVLNEQQAEGVEKGDPGALKRLLGITLTDILRRQAANLMADLLAQPRKRVKVTEAELAQILAAAKGDFDRKTSAKKRAAQVIKKVGMELDVIDARAEKREPWTPTPITFRSPKAITSGS